MDLKSQVLIAIGKFRYRKVSEFFSFGSLLNPKSGKILGQKDEEEMTCYSKSGSVKLMF